MAYLKGEELIAHKEVQMLLGAVVPATGGLHTVFARAQEWLCDGIQLFVTRSRTWDTPSLTDTEVATFTAAWHNSNVQAVVSHVPYLVNLASDNSTSRERSVSRLRLELEHAQRLGLNAAVLHPGSAGRGSDRMRARRFIVEGVKQALGLIAGDKPALLFETMAGQGASIGSTFEELAALVHESKRFGRVGVCLDTAHVFAAGYDISGYQGYQEVMNRFDAIVGIEWLKAIHVNDSEVPFGSRVDRHAAPGGGYIGLEAFHALVRDTRLSTVPMLLELPDPAMTQAAITQLRDLVDREVPVAAERASPRQLSLY